MRIAIVNDIKMTVELLKRVISTNKNHELAWIAYNGQEAIEKCKADTPDLILMDLVMPVLNGVEATRQIMKDTPCAILIVTSSVKSHISMVFDAMGCGALDVTRTPIVDFKSPTFGGEDLLLKIDKVGSLMGKVAKKASYNQVDTLSQKFLPPLLVIGSSTGGPSALTKILSSFPKVPSFATVIIQHVDEQFASSFAQWLGQSLSQNVEIAEDNAEIKSGIVLIAGKNEHLILTDAKVLHYTKNPKDNPFHPSVDVFFTSVAKNWPNKCLAVLLTGMGSDGASGMKALTDAGWYTIAQSKESCVVFGMPKAAIEAKAVSAVLPLEQIGPAVLSFFKDK